MNVLRFKQFKESVYESKKNNNETPVNEGVFKFFSNLWNKVKEGPLKKIGEFFAGKGSWLANLTVLQKKGMLPSGVTIYAYGSIPSNVETISMNDAGIEDKDQILYGFVVKENANSEQISEKDDYVQLKAYKDMPNVNASELKQTISDAFKTKANLMIWGAPGIGKTEIVKQVAESHKASVIVVILSLMEPTDAIGLPEIQEMDGARRTVTRLPIWYPRDNMGIDGNDVGGIMFLDEINRANKAVMNSLLTLVQDRKLDIAGYELPSKWVVIAAANREEDDPGNLEEIGSALGNRFQHVNYAPEAEDWIKWASEKGKSGQQNVLDDIIAFIEFNKDFLHMLNPEAATELWASPRSWANASKQIALVKKSREEDGQMFDEKDIRAIVSRNVSPAVADEFMAFLKVAKQYPLKDIDLAYTAPKKAPVPSKASKVGRVDTSLALLAAVAFARKNKEISDDEFFNLIQYADRIDRAELAMPFIQLFWKLHPQFKDPKFLSDKRVADFLHKHTNS